MKVEQEATPLSKNPVVTVRMIIEKIANLDREIKYLLSKSKLAKPKTKEDKNTTADDKASGEYYDSQSNTLALAHS